MEQETNTPDIKSEFYRITIVFENPHTGSQRLYTVQIPPYMYRSFIKPLPVNREIPWETHARIEAEKMIKARAEFSKELAHMFMNVILKEFQSNDTQNGYPPIKNP